MKYLVACACVAMLCSLPANTENLDLVALESSLVQLAVVSRDGKRVVLIGTAFVAVSDNLVVTAAHLYWQAGTAINKMKGGSIVVQRFSRSGKKFRVPVELVAANDNHDVAIFRFNIELAKKQWRDVNIKPLVLAEKEAEVGDDVAFMGYFGADKYPTLSKGTISGTTADRIPQLVIDKHANRGQSGSPLVLLESGQVVGVMVSFVLTAGPVISGPKAYSGLSRAAKSEYVKNLITSKR